MKKEYKDFYRFLWEYLESGKSAIIIKPRQCGMSQFAMRYAAWCKDYKDMSVNINVSNGGMWDNVKKILDKYTVDRIDGKKDEPARNNCAHGYDDLRDKTVLDIFEEFDYDQELHSKLLAGRGRKITQVLAYSSIFNFDNFNKLYNNLQGQLATCNREIRVFNISDHSENNWRYYPEG
jgi:hypothetical protein